jgi:hypothetical protein
MDNRKTAMQELIDEIVEHLTYDDDLSDDSRTTYETIRLRCLSKLAMEKGQIIEAYEIGESEWTDITYENGNDYYNKTYEQ